MSTISHAAASDGLTSLPDTGANLTLRYLEPSEYALWDALLDVSAQGSVFCRSWWLRAMGDVQVLGCFSGSVLVAGIPLYWATRYGVRVCVMPRLTHIWGVVMRPLAGKTGTVIARETQILRLFATRLSHLRVFVQAFHPSLSSWLPFYWSGFRQTTRFTFIIDDLTDRDRLWNALSATVRRQILRAGKAGIEVVPCSGTDVYRCESQSYLRHRKSPPHSEALVRTIADTAMQNRSGGCFAAVDRDGKPRAAWLHVWDSQSTYDLVGGRDDSVEGSDGNVLLTWHAIKCASQRSRSFDFAGSMVEGIAHFNRGFGAKPVPYNYLFKLPSVLQCTLQWLGKF